MRRAAAGLGALLTALLAGCGDRTAWMPLKAGNAWSYLARTSLSERVINMRAGRDIAVDGVRGREVSGELGATTYAWKGSQLVMQNLPTGRAEPALPLIDLVSKDQMVKWKGKVTSLGRMLPAEATLSQTNEKTKIGTRTWDTLRSTVALKIGGKQVELVTWFVQGIGIVRQEQRSEGEFVLSLEHLSGP